MKIEDKICVKIREKALTKQKNRFVTTVASIATIEDVKEFLESLMDILDEELKLK